MAKLMIPKSCCCDWHKDKDLSGQEINSLKDSINQQTQLIAKYCREQHQELVTEDWLR